MRQTRAAAVTTAFVGAVMVSSCSAGSSDSTESSGESAGSPTVVDEPPASTEIEVLVNGETRRSLLLTPADATDEPLPLLVYLHALRSTPQRAVDQADLDELASSAGVAIAIPYGTSQSWNGGVCCGAAVRQDRDDVAFVEALVGSVDEMIDIELSRVFAAGFSNGAVLSSRLACEGSEFIVAVGIVGGTDWGGDCNPSEPVSVFIMHGTDDRTFTIDAAETLADDWRERLSCGETREEPLGDAATAQIAEDCESGTAVSFIAVDGGTHRWFSEPDATSALWAFLSAH